MSDKFTSKISSSKAGSSKVSAEENFASKVGNNKDNDFSSKVSNEDKYLYQILGVDSVSKRDAWWLVRVAPDKETIFSSIIKKGNLCLSDYGEILTSGFGKTIPTEVLKEHGFRTD